MRVLLFALVFIAALGAVVFFIASGGESEGLDEFGVDPDPDAIVLERDAPSRRAAGEAGIIEELVPGTNPSGATAGSNSAAAPPAPRERTGRTITIALRREDGARAVLETPARVILDFKAGRGSRLSVEIPVPGEIEVEDCPWGQVFAGVDHPTWDLIPDGAGAMGTLHPRQLSAEEKRGNRIELVLAPRRELIGVCVDRAGSVVEGAALRVQLATAAGGGERWFQTATSGPDGSFRLDRLPLTKLRLHPASKAWWIEDITPWIFENERRLPLALASLFVPALEAFPEVVVTIANGRELEGRVVDGAGRTMAGVRVRARDQRGGFMLLERGDSSDDVISEAVADENGAFRLTGLPPLEDLRLEAVVKDGRVARASVDLFEGDRRGFEFVIPDAFRPRLRFTGLPANRIAGVSIYAEWVPPLRQNYERGRRVRLEIGEDGTILLPPIAPGRINVSLRGVVPDSSSSSPPAILFGGKANEVQTFRRGFDLQGDEVEVEIEVLEPKILSGRILLPEVSEEVRRRFAGRSSRIRLARVVSRSPLRVGSDSRDLEVDAAGRFRIPVDASGTYCLTGVKQPGGIHLGRADAKRIIGSPFIRTDRADNLLEVR